VVATDEDRIVGTYATHPLGLAVPGSTLPMAGVSLVAVLPTHRRRGILRRLMCEQLADSYQRGEPLAGLWASEGSIYGRFGFGVATERVRWRIPRAHAVFREPTPAPEGLVLLSPDEALERLPAVHRSIAPTRPGMLLRSAAWWEHRVLADLHGAAFGAQRRVLYAPRGQPLGYALYRTRRFDLERPLELQVGEVVAADPGSERVLWQFLFSVDLTDVIDVWNLPSDHPLRWWLADIHKVERHVSDALWLRLVDLPRSLASRRYAGAGRLVLRVADLVCPWNTGTFALDVDPHGVAECAPTNDPVDIECPVDALGSVYLGGARWTSLAAAGQVHGTPEALQRADFLFSWHQPPWCCERF
jgi:predicted acetyltransferase